MDSILKHYNSSQVLLLSVYLFGTFIVCLSCDHQNWKREKVRFLIACKPFFSFYDTGYPPIQNNRGIPKKWNEGRAHRNQLPTTNHKKVTTSHSHQQDVPTVRHIHSSRNIHLIKPSKGMNQSPCGSFANLSYWSPMMRSQGSPNTPSRMGCDPSMIPQNTQRGNLTTK